MSDGSVGPPPATLEPEIERVGRALAARFPSPGRHPLKALDDRAMELAAQDDELRAALFRFVDVVPACRSVDDLAAHLTGFLDEVHGRPPSLRAAMRMGNTKAGRAALGAIGAAGVRHMAHRFIVGEDPAAALPTLRRLWRDGIAASVDLLGEATVTAEEADRYAARCADALQTLAAAYDDLDGAALLERDAVGALPRANLSVKVSALTPLLRPEAPERGQRDAAPRLRELLRRAQDARRAPAHRHGVARLARGGAGSSSSICSPSRSSPTDRAPASSCRPTCATRRRRSTRSSTGRARTPRARPLVVRLVKGAYWDHEVVEALQHGWSVPVFERKADCDANFEALTVRLLEARPLVRVAIASHNLRSVAHAIARNAQLGGRPEDVEFQVLRGLGDDLGHALAASGLRVRAYCPVGDLVAGMAYLVRRLLENTANDSFLSNQAHGAPLEQLLAPPRSSTA